MNRLAIVCLSVAAAAIVGCGPEGGGKAGVDETRRAGLSEDEAGHVGTARAGEAGAAHEEETGEHVMSHEEEKDAHGGSGAHDDETVTVTMSGGEIEQGGIELMTAGAGLLSRTVDFPAEIAANGDRLVAIVPRVSGVIREVRADLGAAVEGGQVLAVMESSELADLKAGYLASVERSELALKIFEREKRLYDRKISSEQEYLDAKRALAEAEIEMRSNGQKLISMGFSSVELEALFSSGGAEYTRHEIKAPFQGTVIGKKASPGEAVGGESELFVIADLGTVWLDIRVFEKDLASIREGQEVGIVSTGLQPGASGTISHVGPVLETSTRTALARAVIANPSGLLRPGTFVRARVELGASEAAVAVAKEAIQILGDVAVVFVRTAEGFEAHPVTIGAMDSKSAEITSGLSAGQIYAGPGSFSIKAKYVTSGLDSHAGHGH
ncbi:MAG: efflux RND transporter periplasmic adaptor subunit [Candidatus Krumholzibacteria bacterium]|nr:efflux RND transporter periplasmic adaptor subunit [Candidatus Krumholzibacteria bacterium]